MSAAEREFEVDGCHYRAGRLSTFDQLHIASQWRDVLLGLALAKRERPKEISDAAYRDALGVVVTGGLGRLTTQARDEVMRLALSVVTRQQGKGAGVGWSPITSPDGTLMFQDIQLRQLIPILHAVFDHNGILDFFSASPSTQDGQKAGGAGSSSPAARVG